MVHHRGIRMNINMTKISIIFFCLIQFLWTQDYKVLSSQVTGGQSNSNSDSFNLTSGSLSHSVKSSSSDSFSVSQGITGITQSLYALPPVVNAFIADTIYKPKKNSAIIFPSNFMFPHSVNQVIEGTRYSIITWLM